jgi:putative addiction module component (TIGR02574 family)
MISERIPEIQQLSPQERLILATELMGDFEESATPEIDRAIEELIRERLSHYQQHPESAQTWRDLKRSIGKGG